MFRLHRHQEEVLTVIRKVDENWLEGKKGDKIGIFPTTFVEVSLTAIYFVGLKHSWHYLALMILTYFFLY